MIKVNVYKNKDGIYNGFRLRGHAGYADSGQDIICAAVSVLAINTINSIKAFTKDDLEVNSREDDGLLECHISSGISKESALLFQSLFLGLQGIEDEYGKKFIKLSD